MNYTPPIEDMKFGLRYLAGLDQLSSFAPFAEINTELADAVLEEAGKLAADVIAPLNHDADYQGCIHSDNGEVTTPKDLPMPIKRWPKAAGQRWRQKRPMAASTCQWRSVQR